MASKTIELRKDIKKILEEVDKKIFYRRAAANTPYPYISYLIKDVGELKVLEIDYWDNDVSTVNIETLADSVEEVLDGKTITNENYSGALYTNNDRKWIDDDDKTILRINESFEIRYYGKYNSEFFH